LHEKFGIGSCDSIVRIVRIFDCAGVVRRRWELIHLNPLIPSPQDALAHVLMPIPHLFVFVRVAHVQDTTDRINHAARKHHPSHA